MTSAPKSIPPTWFYDEVGSELFEDITRVPEYYPTRVERAILLERADEIVEISKADTLVELGSGSSREDQVLLGAHGPRRLLGARRAASTSGETMLVGAAEELNAAYGVAGRRCRRRHRQHLDKIPDRRPPPGHTSWRGTITVTSHRVKPAAALSPRPASDDGQ